MAVAIGDGAWTDLDSADKTAMYEAGRGIIERVVLLPHGTMHGNPSIEILVRMPDGRPIHAVTTWRLWERATRVFGRSPDSGGL
jgi:hypothetical protein